MNREQGHPRGDPQHLWNLLKSGVDQSDRSLAAQRHVPNFHPFLMFPPSLFLLHNQFTMDQSLFLNSDDDSDLTSLGPSTTQQNDLFLTPTPIPSGSNKRKRAIRDTTLWSHSRSNKIDKPEAVKSRTIIHCKYCINPPKSFKLNTLFWTYLSTAH